MIVERAFAEHLTTLAPGLSVFKDELAWTQAGEPWPVVLVTKTGERLRTQGTGRYDIRTWSEEDQEWVYTKFFQRRITLRLTIRSAAQGGKSGATLVDEVVQAVRGLCQDHKTGLPLDLVDSVSEQEVHLERVIHRGESDQGPLLARVPFEAQSTVDIEVWAAEAQEIQRAPQLETASVILE